jgi:hypothetical protein
MARAFSGPRAVAPALCFGHYLQARRTRKIINEITARFLEE